VHATAAADAEAAAAEKFKQYQDALKRRGAQVYAEQEAARKKVLDERATLLKEARSEGDGRSCGRERARGEDIGRSAAGTQVFWWAIGNGVARQSAASVAATGRRREKLDDARRGVEVAWQRDCDFAIHGDQRACRGGRWQRDGGTRERNLQVD